MIQTTRKSSPRGDASFPSRTDRMDRDFHFIRCESGQRFLIYRPFTLGNPTDHDPARWYFLPTPIEIGIRAGEAFEGPGLAERAALRRVEMVT